ncbi:MAG: sigma-54-dependent Fis family transcriptional regulator [Ktedonobacterales bacterium]|nr:sigma-54-dependent Fis family transcriptional regulator [Ktedonobacterales bacterium]
MTVDVDRILVVEDDEAIRALLHAWLEDEGHFQMSEVGMGDEALTILTGPVAQRPDLVLLDHYLPDMDSSQIQQELLNQGIDIPVILITARSQVQTVIKSMQLGAIDYLHKPFEDSSVVLDAVRKGLHTAHLKRDHKLADIPELDPSEKIVGQSPAMLEIFKTIGRVARTPSTILITGETGTGKSKLAETIHQSSDRRRNQFITFNCAGVPETLLEAALFGAEKGAYTGLDKTRIGYFETANKGTIFLDEIGEMSLTTQTKLLKVLQPPHQIVRLGSTDTIDVDVRVIAATNKNLPLEVQEHRFRQDLYYRLNVITMHMPPLREHKNDIPSLVAHFLKLHRFSPTTPEATITAEALEKLEAYDWPGNVRELENTIQRAVALSRGDLILPEHIILSANLERLTLDVTQRVQSGTALADIVQEAQGMAIRTALRLSDGDHGRSATLLSLPLADFEALRTELGL